MEDIALKSKALLRLSVKSWSGINLCHVGAVSIQRAVLYLPEPVRPGFKHQHYKFTMVQTQIPPPINLNKHAHACTHTDKKPAKIFNRSHSFFEVDSPGGRRDPGEVSWLCRQDDVRCCRGWPPRAAPSCRAARTAPQPLTLLPSDSPDHQQVHRMSTTAI